MGKMPEIGDLARAKDIGKSGSEVWIWTPCSSCGHCRWVVRHSLKSGRQKICLSCAQKANGLRGFNRPGMRRKPDGYRDTSGYRSVYLPADHRFVGMAQKGGCILEHRLIMAEHLDRPLLKIEQVHHCGTRYSLGSYEDKGDNRIENLELMPNPATHNKRSACGSCQLVREIRLLQWQVKELTATLQLKLKEEI